MELVINIPIIFVTNRPGIFFPESVWVLSKSYRSHFNVLRVFQTLWLSMESFYIVFILPIVYWLQDMIWAMLGGRGQTSGSDKALIYLSLVSHFTTSHDISPLPLSESLWSLIRSEQRENVETVPKVFCRFHMCAIAQRVEDLWVIKFCFCALDEDWKRQKYSEKKDLWALANSLQLCNGKLQKQQNIPKPLLNGFEISREILRKDLW